MMNSQQTPTKARYFATSQSILAFQRRKGILAEIIDRTHTSDGGPVAIEWFSSLSAAQIRADELNETADELAFEREAR